MPTTGALSGLPPREPWKRALPKENTPPSAATSQYPSPVGAAAMPTMGASEVNGVARSGAVPQGATWPVRSASQYPVPAAERAIPTTVPDGSAVEHAVRGTVGVAPYAQVSPPLGPAPKSRTCWLAPS